MLSQGLISDVSNFNVQFSPPLQLGSLAYEMALQFFTGINSVFNITSNMTINYTINATPYTCIVPPGLYPIANLSTVLDTSIVNNGGRTLDVQLLANVNSNRSVVQINDSVNVYTVTFTDPHFAFLMGFPQSTVVSSTTTSPDLPNFNSDGSNTNTIDSFNLSVDCIQGSVLNGQTSNIIYSFIPAYSPAGYISERPINLTWIQVNKSIINSINFKMLDNNGNFLNFQGSNWFATLLLRPIGRN